MDKFLLSNLESYLSGRLGGSACREFERRLERNPRARDEIRKMAGICGMFESFDISSEGPMGPAPGFSARVINKIEAERQPEFWDFLMRPLVIRRVAMASCAWLLMLFSASAYDSFGQPTTRQISQAILAEPPESADYCNVRLGCDIDMNRSSMLAAVMVSRGPGQ